MKSVTSKNESRLEWAAFKVKGEIVRLIGEKNRAFYLPSVKPGMLELKDVRIKQF